MGLARANKTAGVGVLAGWFWLSGMCCVPLTVPPALAAADESAAAVPRHAAHPGGAGSLEERIKALSKGLDLDALQQSELRKILLEQRESVQKIWSDHSLLPAERAPATRTVNERTGDEIRAILNDEQKKKYNSATATRPSEQGDQRSVEQWMDATRPH
jgi:hypothetical protein